ncbi:MAG: O-antigen ligase family protein [Candidatus Omnitrophica bacterium]|nr:O-antigen ligase family protein [Candidatus Omnitrophota bacterium]
MKKDKWIDIIFVYILSISIFLRFIFDGITYPQFNLIFTLIIYLLFIFFGFAKFKIINFTYSEISFLLFIIFSIISSILSDIKGTGVRFNTYITSYLCLFFLIRNTFYSEKNKKFLFSTILIITFFITIYGIYQRFWGLEETRKWLMENLNNIDFKNISPTFIDRIQSNRIFSTFIYPNIYASFLISIMPFLFFIFLKENNNLLGIFSISIFFLSFFNLILTESMGGLLIFLFVFHLIFLQIIMDEIKFKKILPFFILIEIFIVFFGYHFKILPHIHSLMDRILYWKASIKIILLNPFFGIGPENFKYYFLKFKLPEGLEAKHAHNLFFEIFVENGIFGLFLFSFFLMYIINSSFKEKKDRYLYLGIFYLFLSFLLHNLIDFDFYDPSVAVLFFIFGGLVNNKRLLSIRLTKMLLCFIIIICIGCGVKLIKFENSERYRRYSEKEKNINLKIYLLENGEIWDNKNFEIYVEKGDLFLNMWQLENDDRYLKESIYNYNKSVSLNPYLTKVYKRLAYLYESIKNYKMAEKMYLKLLEIYPNKKLYNLEIARFYKKIGEEEKFKFYYKKSNKLKGVTTEEGILINEIEKWIELQK